MILFEILDNKIKKTDAFSLDKANEALQYRDKPCNLFENLHDILFPPFQTKPQIRNKRTGAFTVIVSNKSVANALLAISDDNGLTISGDGSALALPNRLTMQTFRKGDFITFGEEGSRFDVDFVRSIDYIKRNSLIPIYDMVDDVEKISEALREYVEEKRKAFKKAGEPWLTTLQMLKNSESGKKQEKKENTKKTITIQVIEPFLVQKAEVRNVGGYKYPKNVVCLNNLFI